MWNAPWQTEGFWFVPLPSPHLKTIFPTLASHHLSSPLPLGISGDLPWVKYGLSKKICLYVIGSHPQKISGGFSPYQREGILSYMAHRWRCPGEMEWFLALLSWIKQLNVLKIFRKEALILSLTGYDCTLND